MSALPDFIARDFQLHEFAVSGEFPKLVRPVPSALVPRLTQLATKGLQVVRDEIGRPMHILSGYRSEALNRAVDGSPTSQHVVGEAADWTCEDIRGAYIAVMKLVAAGKLKDIGQIIYYPAKGFVHMALHSGRFPSPTCCVHWPAREYKYRVIAPDPTLFATLVPASMDPSAPRLA